MRGMPTFIEAHRIQAHVRHLVAGTWFWMDLIRMPFACPRRQRHQYEQVMLLPRSTGSGFSTALIVPSEGLEVTTGTPSPYFASLSAAVSRAVNTAPNAVPSCGGRFSMFRASEYCSPALWTSRGASRRSGRALAEIKRFARVRRPLTRNSSGRSPGRLRPPTATAHRQR